MFGFGYNGQQQISTISEAKDSDADDIIIAKPLKLVPKPESTTYGAVTETNYQVTHVSISWDSILFIFGKYCLYFMVSFRGYICPSLYSNTQPL